MTARDFLALIEKQRAEFEFKRMIRRVAERERGAKREPGLDADGNRVRRARRDHATPHAELTARLGRPPTANELADALRVTLKRAYQIAGEKHLPLTMGPTKQGPKARRAT